MQLTKTGGHDDSNDGAKLHGETTGRRHKGDAVTQVAHDVVSISPQTNDNTSTTKGENPDRDIRLLDGKIALVPDLEDGGIRTDGVGDIVGAVDERGRGSSHDLEEGVEELGLVVEVNGTGVNLLNITSNNRLLVLRADNVLVNTTKQSPLDVPKHDGGVVPRTLGLRTNERLVSRLVSFLALL